MESQIGMAIGNQASPRFALCRMLGLVCLLFFGLLGGLFAQSTWNGNLNSDWTDPSNWDGNSVPGTNATVNIPNTTNIPIVTSNVSISNLVVSSSWNGGSLIVTDGATLTVSNAVNINNNGTIFLDNGHLQVNGGNFNYAYTNTLIQITDGGSLNLPNAYLQVNGELDIQEGDMTLGNGFQVSSGKLFTVGTGNISIDGNANIYGILNGGLGDFIFEGGDVVIRNGGRFFMAPVAPGVNNTPDYPSYPEQPISPGGNILFNDEAAVENNGRFYIGNADVVFTQDFTAQGDSETEIFNGSITFEGEAIFRNSGSISIIGGGEIIVEGDAEFRNSGVLNTGPGDVTVAGTSTFRNSGTLNGGTGTINFQDDVFIANSGGVINAGATTIVFSGSEIENSGTFNAGTSTFIFAGNGSQEITGSNNQIEFYNLDVTETAVVNSEQNVIVYNDMVVDPNGDFTLDPDRNLNVVGIVTGDPQVTTVRPYIISIEIIDNVTIKAIFNQELNPNTAEVAANYSVRDEINSATVVDAISTNPVLGGAGNNEVTITLDGPINIDDPFDLYLRVVNVTNLAGTPVNNPHWKRFGISQFRYYVKIEATGANNGTNWVNAFNTLQEALDVATEGNEIWVATGTYYPEKDITGNASPADIRTKTWQLKNGVTIYGGFNNTGNPGIADRDWETYPTILSGDLSENDGSNFSNRTDNAYHLFYHPDGTYLNSTAVLNGFVLQSGNANGTGTHGYGGAMYNHGSSPTLINLKFEENEANVAGGAIYNRTGSEVTIVNSEFINNRFKLSGTLENGGGAIKNFDASSILVLNSLFENNNGPNLSSESYGGAIYNQCCNTDEIRSSVFRSNGNVRGGGAIANYDDGSNPLILSSMFIGNQARFGGALYGNGGNNGNIPEIVNSVITGNRATVNGGAVYNKSGSNPTFVNVTIAGNYADNDGGGFYNTDEGGNPSNPVLQNSIVWGNAAAGDGQQLYNVIAEVNQSNSFGTFGSVVQIFANQNTSSTTLIHSLYGDSPGDVVGNVSADANSTTEDPLFVDPMDPTSAPTVDGDYKLFEGSPAENSGSNSFLSSYDLDGDVENVNRIEGDIVNMGAFETIIPNATQPIRLLYFRASKLVDDRVQLDWATASEENNDYFIIERSVDGNEWEAITQKSGAGNSSQTLTYQYIDENPIIGVSYYRLKQVDFDGSISVSPLERIIIEANGKYIKLAPNPVSDQLFIINNYDRGTQFQVYNTQGSLVYTSTIDSERTTMEVYSLPKGVYVLKVLNNSNPTSLRFLKK
ncbi:T9SS type A sorting domain-containing protein [Peijinzhouia sedimentorum]